MHGSMCMHGDDDDNSDGDLTTTTMTAVEDYWFLFNVKHWYLFNVKKCPHQCSFTCAAANCKRLLLFLYHLLHSFPDFPNFMRCNFDTVKAPTVGAFRRPKLDPILVLVALRSFHCLLGFHSFDGRHGAEYRSTLRATDGKKTPMQDANLSDANTGFEQ